MDLTTLLHNLREEVSCSVCSDLFTDPKHLSCLHSFCLNCLKGWYETCGGGDTIRCPKCQILGQVPASGDLKDLPTSFYLNGLIDVLAIKECKNTQVAETATRRAQKLRIVSSVAYFIAKNAYSVITSCETRRNTAFWR